MIWCQACRKVSHLPENRETTNCHCIQRDSIQTTDSSQPDECTDSHLTPIIHRIQANDLQDILDFYMDWVDTNCPTVYDDFHIAEAITSSVFGAIHTTSQVLSSKMLYAATI
jgi:hypothetical protein